MRQLAAALSLMLLLCGRFDVSLLATTTKRDTDTGTDTATVRASATRGSYRGFTMGLSAVDAKRRVPEGTAGRASSSADVRSWFEACANNDASALDSLLQKNPALLNLQQRVPQDTGYTCLMLSSLSGSEKAADFVLERGADPNIAENDGYTAMHGVGFQGRDSVLPVLLKYGIDPSHMHADGFTPIHRAAWGTERRHTRTVRAFVEIANVSVYEKSRDGKMAIDMAKTGSTKKALDFLERREKENQRAKKMRDLADRKKETGNNREHRGEL
jgi:hypothetical protein